MNAKLIAALGAGATILAISQTATAGVSVGLAVGAPVYAAPAPVYAAPAYVGWRDDDRRWDDRRWGDRRWEDHRWNDHHWGRDRRWDDHDRDYGYRRW
ncbi:hypothetical protein LMG28688_01800 [Paraburkholderia caffeinitolerans]|uniref:Uncharacterized protein n=1 Tax=Paraburkholderia caffeinitolerans TaxID=1723730 RepID=A0A6J5FP59_9BURK|nr:MULTISPECIES: hypothetical protein [Paraburkholderia]CAB3784109.1 hypothetical protein LMG28688_01800 [Paraburkholderia caffeinitolerans]